MICKKCGKEIDDNSLYCEFCGHKNNDIIKSNINNSATAVKKSKKLKKWQKIILAIVIILLLIFTYFLTVEIWYSNNYYGQVDCAISEINYTGEQFIESINIDKDDNHLVLNFANNNFNSVLGYKWCIENVLYNIEENYCAYDSVTEKYTFEPKPMLGNIINLDENNEQIEKRISIDDLDCSEFIENTVYGINLEFYIDFSNNYGNPIEKLLIKTVKNTPVYSYIYLHIPYIRDYFNMETERYSTYAYFLYKDGQFIPISESDNLDEYVNAIWQGTDLNLIKYDENGQTYLEGPIKTRENIKIN